MIYYEDNTKAAIKNLEVFEGLAIDDKEKFRDLFLNDPYKLIVFLDDGIVYGHIIYEIVQDTFVFHLVNFTRHATQNMTEIALSYVIAPFCYENGVKYIQATAERPGMAKKLEKLGFKQVEGRIFRGEAEHVL